MSRMSCHLIISRFSSCHCKSCYVCHEYYVCHECPVCHVCHVHEGIPGEGADIFARTGRKGAKAQGELRRQGRPKNSQTRQREGRIFEQCLKVASRTVLRMRGLLRARGCDPWALWMKNTGCCILIKRWSSESRRWAFKRNRLATRTHTEHLIRRKLRSGV